MRTPGSFCRDNFSARGLCTYGCADRLPLRLVFRTSEIRHVVLPSELFELRVEASDQETCSCFAITAEPESPASSPVARRALGLETRTRKWQFAQS
ncbi:hypothetical protein PAXRUDRAFT_834778 [Paxillus rubicundulus Ve08.2h10]|uniref:Uncharacterized protein n=1 Tax=Paxillus rubicundulus Ve08.2h10 TaxID=930991 RepID=A0A0D0C4F3_9AGAM|nr:hypothetical protein PAXRUDRAFT_834778 [Paxillus rubicundulus Ve08.2h10]